MIVLLYLAVIVVDRLPGLWVRLFLMLHSFSWWLPFFYLMFSFLFVLLIIGDVVPSLLLVIGDAAPNVNEVADPLLFVGSVDVVVGLLMFNLDESKENAGDDCLDESKENTAVCLKDSSFDLSVAAAVLLVTLLLSFDDIVVCGI